MKMDKKDTESPLFRSPQFWLGGIVSLLAGGKSLFAKSNSGNSKARCVANKHAVVRSTNNLGERKKV